MAKEPFADFEEIGELGKNSKDGENSPKHLERVPFESSDFDEKKL